MKKNINDNDKEISKASRLLTEMRLQVEKTCIVCGKLFVGIKTKKYCSNACSCAAWRMRKAQKENRKTKKNGVVIICNE